MRAAARAHSHRRALRIASRYDPPMAIDVRRADIAGDAEAIRAIRTAVFVVEQRVPLDLEMDDRDARCVHVLAWDDDAPVGTGRIDLEHDGKIGRVAVLASHRRSGVGAALMAHLHRIALGHGLTHVWCHAQRSAVPFYERLGYRITSEPFLEAGIEHVSMETTLAGHG
jgi:predicted GNAT family N-acyltransferase